MTEIQVAEFGRFDGQKWANRTRGKVSPLTVAKASGVYHIKKVEAGKLATGDVLCYCQTFIESAITALGDRCAW